MPDVFSEADVRLYGDWESNLKYMVEKGITV